MYFYLYDSFVEEKKYAKELTDLEARLIDLTIQGRTGKLNILNDIGELIKDAVKSGAETVVVLGDDKTVSKAIHAMVDLDATLGIIPLGNGPHTLARYLGIPEGVQAAEVLSKRVKERIDVLKINGNYCAFYLKSLSPYVSIVSEDEKYRIAPMGDEAEVYICNFRPPLDSLVGAPASFFVPQDGKLEVLVNAKEGSKFFGKFFSKKSVAEGYTVLPFKKVRIEALPGAKDVKLVIDNDKIIKPPVTVEVVPRAVELIVGQERGF